MADVSLATRGLALVGFATIAGGVHSLVVPVRLDRDIRGIVIPGGVEQNGSAGEQQGKPKTDTSTEPGDGNAAFGTGEGKIDLQLASTLHEKFMAGEPVLFLDARLRSDFEDGRIVGALHMPHARLSGGEGLDELAMFASPGEGMLLVIYCTGGDCEASEDSAILLDAAGYTNIAIMADGYDDWAASGLPVEGAEAPGVSP
ncbi:MAG: rhodanese-like domain-containing protein [Phycisphaerales bacterium]|nr:rhodanese-like domain-containing protein [Phycisphaerales bacterium]